MAPKKAAKQAAKKAPGKPDPHKQAKDARRTFEHLGRVQALSKLASSESETLKFLSQTADAAYQVQRYKESADLLRTAEHLSFAAIYGEVTEDVATDLKAIIKQELEHLIERSKEHATKHVLPKEIGQVLARLTSESRSATRRGSWRAALELARGAEAISHVHDLGGKSLPPAKATKRLQSSR